MVKTVFEFNGKMFSELEAAKEAAAEDVKTHYNGGGPITWAEPIHIVFPLSDLIVGAYIDEIVADMDEGDNVYHVLIHVHSVDL